MNAEPVARTRLWDVAVEQHGFVTIPQARELGVSQAAIAMLAKRGRLEKEAHGVYRMPQMPASEYDQFALAVLWTGVPEACLSHETALDLYEISNINPHIIHVTVGKDRRIRRRNENGYAVHYENLDPRQIGWWQQIPMVTAATAIAQCIAFGTPIYLLRQAIEKAHVEGRIQTVERDQLAHDLEVRHDKRQHRLTPGETV
jgi:predicted transcriptional regulator of viral defense system